MGTPYTAHLATDGGTLHVTAHTAGPGGRPVSTPLDLGLPDAPGLAGIAQAAAERGLAAQGWAVVGEWTRTGDGWRADLVADPGGAG